MCSTSAHDVQACNTRASEGPRQPLLKFYVFIVSLRGRPSPALPNVASHGNSSFTGTARKAATFGMRLAVFLPTATAGYLGLAGRNRPATRRGGHRTPKMVLLRRGNGLEEVNDLCGDHPP